MKENILLNNFFPESSESDYSSSCSVDDDRDDESSDESIDFTCVICQEQIECVSSESVLEIINCDCNFYYHPECLLRWYIESKTCPTCRKPIGIKDINLLSYDMEAVEWNSYPMSELLTREEGNYMRDEMNRNNLGRVDDLVEVAFHEDTYCEKFLKVFAILFVATIFFYILIVFLIYLI
jgi:hypothetical protein